MKKLPARSLLSWSAIALSTLLLAACSRTEAPAEPVRAVIVKHYGK